jgi:hypothetical protein
MKKERIEYPYSFLNRWATYDLENINVAGLDRDRIVSIYRALDEIIWYAQRLKTAYLAFYKFDYSGRCQHMLSGDLNKVNWEKSRPIAIVKRYKVHNWMRANNLMMVRIATRMRIINALAALDLEAPHIPANISHLNRTLPKVCTREYDGAEVACNGWEALGTDGEAWDTTCLFALFSLRDSIKCLLAAKSAVLKQAVQRMDLAA